MNSIVSAIRNMGVRLLNFICTSISVAWKSIVCIEEYTEYCIKQLFWIVVTGIAFVVVNILCLFLDDKYRWWE